MSGVIKTLFGGKSEKSDSFNKAYDPIMNATSGALPYITQGGNALSALLGLGGSEAQQAGFDRYKDSMGYQFMMDSGSKAITGNQASRGLLNSGSTLKALTKFGQGTGAQYTKDYFSQLLDFGKLGLGAGSLLSDAGKTSTGTSSTHTENFGKALGAIFASDKRLKEDIIFVRELVPGINVYTFKYKGQDATNVGVMAQEVKEVFPEALGPTTPDGFMTVNYGRLNELVMEAA